MRLVESKLHFWIVNFLMIHPRQGFDGFSAPVHILLIVILALARPAGPENPGNVPRFNASRCIGGKIWENIGKYVNYGQIWKLWTNMEKYGKYKDIFSKARHPLRSHRLSQRFDHKAHNRRRLDHRPSRASRVCVCTGFTRWILFSWACNWEEATLGLLFA